MLLITNYATKNSYIEQCTGATPAMDGSTSSLEAYGTELGAWTITGYCGCEKCCGIYASEEYRPNGKVIGASGRILESGYSCATNSLPLGTIIEIEGLGTWRVDDRGTTGIDLYYDTHERASEVGRQSRNIKIVGGDNY